MDPLSAIRPFMPSSAAAMLNNPGALGQMKSQAVGSPAAPQPATSTPAISPALPGGPDGAFANTFDKFVTEVEKKQQASSDAVGGLLTGQNVPLHQAMIAMEEASVSFQLMVEVRNKLLESYQELMRMQV